MLRRALQKEEGGSLKRITFIKTLIQGGDKPCWNYDELSHLDIFNLQNQPIKNPLVAAQKLGWPQQYLPGLVY
jgi:hypothetical protein